MTIGRIDYSPDYQLVTEVWLICPNCGNPDCAEAEELKAEIIKQQLDRARLEREVIEKAKVYGRAARATEEHMKTADASQANSDEGWRLLRDLESTWELLMLEAVDALLDYEQQHGIKQEQQ